MNAEYFTKIYCEKSNVAIKDFNKTQIVLKCNCNEPDCKGFAAVSNNPLSIKTHNILYGSK